MFNFVECYLMSKTDALLSTIRYFFDAEGQFSRQMFFVIKNWQFSDSESGGAK